MKWNIHLNLPYGHDLKWKVNTDPQKRLKEFGRKAKLNKDRRHFSTHFEISDREYDSSFSVHIER